MFLIPISIKALVEALIVKCYLESEGETGARQVYWAIHKLNKGDAVRRSLFMTKHKVRDVFSSNAFSWPYECEWDVDAVDPWVDSTLDHAAVNSLIAFALEDATVVGKVGI